MGPGSIRLAPAIIEEDGLDEFLSKNRTLKAAMSPRTHSLSIFQSVNILPQPPNIRPSGSVATSLHFVQWDTIEESRRQFISDSYVIYDAFHNELEALRARSGQSLFVTPVLERYHERCGLYLDIIRKQLRFYEALLAKNPTIPDIVTDNAIFEVMFTAFSLFQTIFLPSHGVYNALVGRELLHWLNSNFLTSMEEEGNELLQVEAPWLLPNFWTFIKSCTIRLIFRPVTHFLRKLCDSHNHTATKEIATLIVAGLNSMPSSEEYDHESDYSDAHRQWKISLHKLQQAIERHASQRYDGKADLEEIAMLMDGSSGILQRLCVSCGLTWRDAICVYGIWIHPRLTREDLPNVAAEVLEDMPVDPTSTEEMLYAALFKADVVQAASLANDVDIWLVAHMTDMLEALPLPEGNVMANIRQYFVMAYAEHLMADPSQWRLAVRYLSHCGTTGMGTANQILSHLPFRLPGSPSPDESQTSAPSAGPKPQQSPLPELDEVLTMCAQLDLHEAQQEICRTAAQKLTALRLYGKAVEYCARFSDVRALKQVVHALANEYLEHGPREFVSLVDQIPSQFLYPPEEGSGDETVFTSRLHFIVTYAEFHHAMSQDTKTPKMLSDVVALMSTEGHQAPQSWWGLLLADIGESLAEEDLFLEANDMNLVLARLQEVFMKSQFGGGLDYLWALMQRYSMNSEAEALQRLERARFSLIQSAARSMISRVGGKGIIFDDMVDE